MLHVLHSVGHTHWGYSSSLKLTRAVLVSAAYTTETSFVLSLPAVEMGHGGVLTYMSSELSFSSVEEEELRLFPTRLLSVRDYTITPS